MSNDPLSVSVEPPADGRDTVFVMAGFAERTDTFQADHRGRVNLGTEYADERVRVAVVEVVGDE